LLVSEDDYAVERPRFVLIDEIQALHKKIPPPPSAFSCPFTASRRLPRLRASAYGHFLRYLFANFASKDGNAARGIDAAKLGFL